MNRIAIGKIATNYGYSGLIKVHSFSGELHHFKRLRKIYLLRRGEYSPYEVEEVRATGARIVMKLAGVDDKEAAKRLSGSEIWVDRRYASRRKRGEYYVGDLCGCGVFSNKGYVGTVRSVSDFGAGDILEIERKAGEPIMVPFSDTFVRKVNVKRGRILLREDSIKL
jgi:16S rRNA processing protein RimM